MTAKQQAALPEADLGGSNVLFVAYFFPPTISTGVPGCMRTIKFLRNLKGGQCHVLTTPEAQLSPEQSALSHIELPVHDETIHRVASRDVFQVLLTARRSVKGLVKRGGNSGRAEPATSFRTATSATAQPDNGLPETGRFQQMKDFIYNLCYFPDQAGPWVLPAVARARRIVREQNIDVIFATGSPWSDLIVGYLVSRLTRTPLIVDFRDPWMNNPFHPSKGALLDAWALRWEQRIVEHANAVSLNTEPLKQEFLQRYPRQPADKFFVMPNGFDLADFTASEAAVPDSRYFTLCHAGFLYGVRDPAPLLQAIEQANRQLADSGRQIRFRQIGDIQLNYDVRERFGALIDDGSLMIEPPQPYQQCLQALTGADMVVNIQPATRSQVPSKLYDYLAINRPILNITPRDGALGTMVEEYGLGELFDFEESEALARRLVEIVQNDEYSGSFEGYNNRSRFDSRHTAWDLAEKIKALTS